MSQPCATVCIQVPMLEVQAPIHMRRKARYWNALKVLLTLVSITAVATQFPSSRYSIRMDEVAGIRIVSEIVYLLCSKLRPLSRIYRMWTPPLPPPSMVCFHGDSRNLRVRLQIERSYR